MRTGFVGLLALLASGSTACATIVVDSPDYLEENAPPQVFEAGRDRCLAALHSSLKDLRYEVPDADVQKGEFKTNRRAYTATVSTSKGFVDTEHSTVHLSNQFWFKVVADDSTCEIALTRARYWDGEVERQKLTPPNATWVRANLIRPIFEGVAENLRDSK